MHAALQHGFSGDGIELTEEMEARAVASQYDCHHVIVPRVAVQPDVLCRWGGATVAVAMGVPDRCCTG